MRLFAGAVFTGAFLLFLVQPLIGKYILPRFGSAPGVWATCLLFFQVLLLAGYAYSHLLARRLSPRAQAVTHVVLLGSALLLLPITPPAPDSMRLGGDPTWQILLLLARSVGLPYLLLSATGPLFMSWFARTAPGRSPYRLYALSNLGSMLALVAYPFVVEPFVGLSQQTIGWSVAFVVFAALGVACARQSALAAPAPAPAEERSPRPPWTVITYWVALAACGSGLMMATTNRLCTDVAVVPFLWVLPLGIYLLTFVICFDHDRWYSRPVFFALLPAALAAAAVSLQWTPEKAVITQIVTGTLTLFVCLMCCHGELARRRPDPGHLTTYYLAIALGGALGGLFVAVVSPLIFPDLLEYHVLLLACFGLILVPAIREYLRPKGGSTLSGTARIAGWTFVAVATLLTVLYFDPDRWLPSMPKGLEADQLDGLLRVTGTALFLTVALAVVIARPWRLPSPTGRGLWLRWTLPAAFGLGLVPLVGLLTWDAFLGERMRLERRRNFYGAVRIVGMDEPLNIVRLFHGRITHGQQNRLPVVRTWPSTYYGPRAGVGIAIRGHPKRNVPGRPFRIGVVGLGAGTLAAYGNARIVPSAEPSSYSRPVRREPGDRVVFYEINSLVVDWSRRYFTFIEDAEGRGAIVTTHVGDARIVMERQLARGEPQAFDVLAVDAFNSDAVPIHLLTNECFRIYASHLADDGILAFHVSNLHLDLAPVVHQLARHNGWESVFIENASDVHHGVDGSSWVLVTKSQVFLAGGEIAPRYGPTPVSGPLWTDDFSSIFELLRSPR